MIKTILNPDATKPWLTPLGQLVANFGSLEYFSHLWIEDFTDEETSKKFAHEHFAERTKQAEKLLNDGQASTNLKTQGSNLWKEARDLAKRRNSILHNPLIFVSLPSDTGETHELACIPDVRSVIRSPDEATPITLTQLNKLVNDIAACARKLETVRNQLRSTPNAATQQSPAERPGEGPS